ncbi:hypothetical protein LVJ94_32880 [Pendulispora rubella]|uniref:Uncharacterized protein n=1 Tax=Pendulispora rubella TaxID=2741070 RepID=A0ABZ2KT39_9BACT
MRPIKLSRTVWRNHNGLSWSILASACAALSAVAACSGANGPGAEAGGDGASGTLADAHTRDGTIAREGNTGTDDGLACASGAWCWQQPQPSGNDIHGIWVSSANDVWTVGKRGTISHYDGASWKTIHVDDEELRGIWGASPSDIWAVGSNEVILHYDGTSWKRVHGGAAGGITGGAVAKLLTGIWGSASNDIWAVTPNLSFLHYDGTAWSAAETDYGDVGTLDCTVKDHDRIQAGIWGSSKRNPVAVSCNSTIAILEPNQRWVVVRDDANAYWHAVWGGFGNMWKGGSRGIYHNNDLDLKIRPGDSVSAIVGTSSDDLWAVTYLGMIYHREFSRWNSVSGAPPEVGLLAVGASAGRTLIAGTHGHLLVPSGSVVTDFPGTAPFARAEWRSIAIPAQDDENVWVVGETSVIRRAGGAWSLANRTSDGTPLPDESPLAVGRRVVAAGPDDVWSLRGRFPYHFDGSTWTKANYTMRNGDEPNELSATGRDDVWMVGRGKTVDHFDGTNWTSSEIFSDFALGSAHVHARTPTDVWVAAEIIDDATSDWIAHVHHYNGSTWTAENQTASGNSMNAFNRIYAPQSGEAWATSSTGLHHYTGGKWHDVHPALPPGDNDSYFDDIDGSGPNDVWALHETSSRLFALYHFDGTNWTYEMVPTNERLKGITVGPKRIWVAGTNGVLLARGR